jgi:hypothetical protein
MKLTKQKTEWESRPRHYGKSTFVKDSFIAECKAGNSVEYHARDYVCMSRKRYEELSTQRQQLIKAIIKNLKFYNWKGNIKTVELKEYLKSL